MNDLLTEFGNSFAFNEKVIKSNCTSLLVRIKLQEEQ